MSQQLISNEQLDQVIECLSEPALGLLIYCRTLASRRLEFHLIDGEAIEHADALAQLNLLQRTSNHFNIANITMCGFTFTELGEGLMRRVAERGYAR